MKTVLITGASGFVGQALIKQFSDNGWATYGLVNKNITRWLRDQEGYKNINLIKANIIDYNLLRDKTSHLDAIETIVHCAAKVSDIGRRSDFFKTNYLGTRNILRIVKNRPETRLIYLSSTDVYGLKDFNGENEDSLPFELNKNNYYPYYKVASENLINKFLEKDRFVIVRPGAIWGNGDKTITPRIISFLKTFPILVHFGKWNGNNRWPISHIDNVSRAIYMLADTIQVNGQAINLLDNEHLSINEFYRSIGRVLASKENLKSINISTLFWKPIAKTISILATSLNMTNPPLDPTDYALRMISSNLDMSNNRMKELFKKNGASLISFEEGLRLIAPCGVKVRSTDRRKPHTKKATDQ